MQEISSLNYYVTHMWSTVELLFKLVHNTLALSKCAKLVISFFDGRNFKVEFFLCLHQQPRVYCNSPCAMFLFLRILFSLSFATLHHGPDFNVIPLIIAEKCSFFKISLHRYVFMGRKNFWVWWMLEMYSIGRVSWKLLFSLSQSSILSTIIVKPSRFLSFARNYLNKIMRTFDKAYLW